MAKNEDSWNPPGGSLEKIVIDPGHGGLDSGAISVEGYEEKSYVLNQGLIVAGMCASMGMATRVALTRISDVSVSLAKRVAVANRWNATVFISLHCNASSDEKASGTQVLYWKTSRWGKRLAEILLRYIGPLDGKTREEAAEKTIGMPDPVFRQARDGSAFVPYVLKYTRMPAVIIETEFITNPWDARAIIQPTYTFKVCRSIVQATREWYSEIRTF
jgi:N-acetylmuramoyl-L-alanine amidase